MVLLSIIVGAIWLSVILRIQSALKPSPAYQNTSANISDSIYIDTISDHYVIKGNYKDPFQKKPIKPKSLIKKKLESKPIVKTEPVNPWPKIEYQGLIKKGNDENKIAIFHINGKSVIGKQGEVFENVAINKISPDTLEVTFNKEKKKIAREGFKK